MVSEYGVLLSGLRDGTTKHRYTLDNTFFKDFKTDLFKDCKINVDLTLTKGSTQTEILFKVSGYTILPCDLSGRMFECPIENRYTLIVKYSDKTMEEFGDDVVYVFHGNQQVDLRQVIYDTVYLSIPSKRIHPEEKLAEGAAFFYTTGASHFSKNKEQLVKQ